MSTPSAPSSEFKAQLPQHQQQIGLINSGCDQDEEYLEPLAGRTQATCNELPTNRTGHT